MTTKKDTNKVMKTRQDELIKADMLQFKREVIGNKALRNDVSELQKRLGLPIPDGKEFVLWQMAMLEQCEQTNHIGQDPLSAGEEALIEHYGLQRWEEGIRSLVRHGEVNGGVTWLAVAKGIYPSFKRRDDGSWYLEVTAYTWLDSPSVQRMMRAWQLKQLAKVDPMPTHRKRLASNKRAFDWRPLWEWSKRHPNIRIKEIAIALGLKESYVYRVLGAINKK